MQKDKSKACAGIQELLTDEGKQNLLFTEVLPRLANALSEPELAYELDQFELVRLSLTREMRGSLLAVAKDVAKNAGWGLLVQRIVQMYAVEKAEIEGAGA